MLLSSFFTGSWLSGKEESASPVQSFFASSAALFFFRLLHKEFEVSMRYDSANSPAH